MPAPAPAPAPALMPDRSGPDTTVVHASEIMPRAPASTALAEVRHRWCWKFETILDVDPRVTKARCSRTRRITSLERTSKSESCDARVWSHHVGACASAHLCQSCGAGAAQLITPESYEIRANRDAGRTRARCNLGRSFYKIVQPLRNRMPAGCQPRWQRRAGTSLAGYLITRAENVTRCRPEGGTRGSGEPAKPSITGKTAALPRL